MAEPEAVSGEGSVLSVPGLVVVVASMLVGRWS